MQGTGRTVVALFTVLVMVMGTVASVPHAGAAPTNDDPPGNSGSALGQLESEEPGNSGDAPGQSEGEVPGNSGNAPNQSEEAPGNAEAAHACQQGGWEGQAPASEADAAFESQGDCVVHGAQNEEGVTALDSDLDGVADEDDICPGGDDHADNDGDKTPDFCDPDDDNDGFSDAEELDLGTDPLKAESKPDTRCNSFESWVRQDGTQFDSAAACNVYVVEQHGQLMDASEAACLGPGWLNMSRDIAPASSFSNEQECRSWALQREVVPKVDAIVTVEGIAVPNETAPLPVMPDIVLNCDVYANVTVSGFPVFTTDSSLGQVHFGSAQLLRLAPPVDSREEEYSFSIEVFGGYGDGGSYRFESLGTYYYTVQCDDGI